MKVRHLKKESLRRTIKDFIKKVLWCLVDMSFTLGISFEQIGKVIGINLHIMISIGWFILAIV